MNTNNAFCSEIKRVRNNQKFIRLTLRKSFPPKSTEAAQRFSSLATALSGVVPVIKISIVHKDSVQYYSIGPRLARGLGNARRAYRFLVKSVLEEFFPQEIVDHLLGVQRLGVLELKDVTC